MPLVIFNLFREFIILRAVILGGLNEKLKKLFIFRRNQNIETVETTI